MGDYGVHSSGSGEGQWCVLEMASFEVSNSAPYRAGVKVGSFEQKAKPHCTESEINFSEFY
jgi:hypothetical protein